MDTYSTPKCPSLHHHSHRLRRQEMSRPSISMWRLISFAAVGSIAVVLAYGLLDDTAPRQRVLSTTVPDSTERPRCPVQPAVLDIGPDWVGICTKATVPLADVTRTRWQTRDSATCHTPDWLEPFASYAPAVTLQLAEQLTVQPTESHDDSPLDAADARWDVFYRLEEYLCETFPLL